MAPEKAFSFGGETPEDTTVALVEQKSGEQAEGQPQHLHSLYAADRKSEGGVRSAKIRPHHRRGRWAWSRRNMDKTTGGASCPGDMSSMVRGRNISLGLVAATAGVRALQVMEGQRPVRRQVR